MFSIVRLLGLTALVGGGATLLWYGRLSQDEQAEADRIAADYAKRLYGKAVTELSRSEASYVSRLTGQHFGE